MKIDIKYIYCGKEEKINDGKRDEYLSSYRKKPINYESYLITKEGFELDTQSDKPSHGGIDKAVCVYSLDEYTYLEKKYDIKLPDCAFGENLSILGANDSDICLGDKFSCGEVIFEVSQPRQPCWKISSIIGIKKLTAIIVKEYKTGFYLRVLQSGNITPKDKLELISRTHPKFTIEIINKIAYNAKKNQEAIKELLGCSELSRDYHESLAKRYKDKEVGLQEWQRDDYL